MGLFSQFDSVYLRGAEFSKLDLYVPRQKGLEQVLMSGNEQKDFLPQFYNKYFDFSATPQANVVQKPTSLCTPCFMAMLVSDDWHDLAPYSIMKSRAPATQALNKLLKPQDSQSSLGSESQRIIKRMSTKRSSSSMLDMTSLLEASDEIEGCPSFPSIEWPTLENEQYSSDLCAPQIKKRCNWFVSLQDGMPTTYALHVEAHCILY